ncbi:hypothetical protein [Macrococcus armenti]|uniref:hypothetical protein n=1 Tax=Macrococcus armenti TaxID=2875764 RepID=UPI001CD59341|nr:hypothetical protein [Macrococcus armenti]UBH10595.1 hypothetical protein LAU38_10210 [Macrococcus armenti]
MIEQILNKYNKTNEAIISKLETFNLPIFQNTVNADERPEVLNLFIVLYGDWSTIDDGKRQLQQDIFITYLSENRDDVDEMVIKVANELQKINLIKFVSSQTDYVQKSGTEEYVDRVILRFSRGGGLLEC